MLKPWCDWKVGIMDFPRAANLSFQEMEAGRSYVFDAHVTAAVIDRFAALSGDFSPLHMDDVFARSRGFAGRVVHGAFLSSLASQIVGMHLPGENCLLHSLHMKFARPVIAGTTVRVTGTVDQMSEATRAAVIAIYVTDPASGEAYASGKAVIGITEAK
jgi:3-hydroxybutyryl-CoA dehydratase